MSNQTPSKESWFKIIAIVLAFFILVGYAIFLYFLVEKANTEKDEIIWTRLIYLFSGFEAIVFSAVGFIFGREVNRRRAEKAEVDTKVAQQNEIEAKEKAKEEEIKGKSLAQHILSKTETPANAPHTMGIRSSSKAAPENEIVDLALFAKRMYPNIED